MTSKRICLPYPSEDVTHRTLQRLESLLIHDSDAKSRLAEIEAEAERFRQERSRLQKQIFRCRAAISPMRGVPLEVLAHIFGFLVSVCPDAIAQVGLVCRMWKEATQFPNLWSNISIATERRLDEQKVDLFLRRSGQIPLSITYVQSMPQQLPWDAWSAVLLSACRWRSLSLHFDDCAAASSRIKSLVPAPHLAELSIAIRSQCDDQAQEGKFGFESNEFMTSNPRLQSLYLSTFILPTPNSSFARLTKIHITDTYSQLENPKHDLAPIRAHDLLGLLINCVNLEDFTFNAEQSSLWFVRAAQWQPVRGLRFSLSHLRRLHLNCHCYVAYWVLAYITAEALESATLLMRPRGVVQDHGGLTTVTAHFVIRSQRLRFLHINGLKMGVILAGSIKGLRYLEELYLEHVVGLDTIIERFMKEQQHEVVPEPFWYVPRLSSLTIVAHPRDVPYDKLGAVVKARFSANLLNGVPNRIEKLVVNEQDMLTGVAPGEMVKFERLQRFQKHKK